MKLLICFVPFMSFLIIAMGDPYFVPTIPFRDEEKTDLKEKQGVGKKAKNQNIRRQEQEEKRPTSSSPTETRRNYE